MNTLTKTAGAALALAAATALTGCYGSNSTSTKASNEHSAHCYGVNKCSGHNDCKSAENSCKGQAKCKGHGFVAMSEKACDDVGGTVGK